MSKLLKSILKIAFPAFGESLDFNCTAKQSDVALLAGVEQGDIAHPYVVLAFFNQSNRVSRADLTLLQHRKIKACALARQQPFDDISATEFDAELVTGIRGSVTMTTTEPTLYLSPILSSGSKSPALVKFSPVTHRLVRSVNHTLPTSVT